MMFSSTVITEHNTPHQAYHVIGVYQDGSTTFSPLNEALQEPINKLGMTQEAGKIRVTSTQEYPHVVLLSLGETGKLSLKKLLSYAQSATQMAIDYGASDIIQTLHLSITKASEDTHHKAKLLHQSISYGMYRFDVFKTDKTPQPLIKNIMWLSTTPDRSLLEQALKEAQHVANGVTLARNLADMPANVCTPSYLAETAENLAQEFSNLSVEIFGEEEIQAIGMHSFLAVAKGSVEPPKFIVARYNNAPSIEEAPYILVGKGITFDSGGISLKPGEGMDDMKYDMGGAAAVLGCLRSVLEAQLPINMIVLIPSCENLPSGQASKPSDVLTTLSGITVEILNTDAEGRLILCDALTYAERFNPKLVIDVATLTGACVVALGNVASGMYTNREEELVPIFKESSQKTLDYAWHMPLLEEYQELIKGKCADIANINTSMPRTAGSITAACFLSRFTQAYPWVHLDVAGPAMPAGGKMGTGRPVSLLFDVLKHFSQA
jgi:leucyl aminopeptidase